MAARTGEALSQFETRHAGAALASVVDVTQQEAVRAAVDAGVRAFGRIDVVVNNAGYGLFGALEELSDDELRAEFETNVFGSLNVTRAALPHMRRQRSGHLVQISSLEGIAPALAGESAYAGTKFAVEGIAEGLAKDVEHLGIRVTIVEPGPLRTGFAGGAIVTPPKSDDYAESVGAALERFGELDGNQPNDPRRVAEAIIAAVDAEEPPLRLPLGEEAMNAIREKLEAQQRELDAWGDLGVSAPQSRRGAHPVVRALHEDEHDWMQRILRERWPHELLVGRGRVHQASELSALVAVEEHERVGLLTYVVEGEVAELVTLDALRPGLGVGAMLIEGLAELAPRAGARLLVAMVTNDNVRGLRYYQRLGFRMNELRAGAMDELRVLRPWIPQTGQEGIFVRDEIDLVRDL
jgi:NAD(P)-dependent dehydrogenase (short-subunit alcohol dehydrogenase family)